MLMFTNNFIPQPLFFCCHAGVKARLNNLNCMLYSFVVTERLEKITFFDTPYVIEFFFHRDPFTLFAKLYTILYRIEC
jgi:hypothetical protein